jgi:hypothetical protein
MAWWGGGEAEPFPSVDKCDASRLGRGSTVVADLDGALLRSPDAFPYYALVAFETGGAARLSLLLLLSPLAAALRRAVSESAGTRVLVFAATAGARRAAQVLPRRRAPRRVEGLLRVRGTEAGAHRRAAGHGRAVPQGVPRRRRCRGNGARRVAGTRRGGVLVGESKAQALREMLAAGEMPDVGLGHRRSDYAFMTICKVAHIL